MKYIMAVILSTVFVSMAIAAPVVTKLSFKPIGTTTDITCTVFGMKKSMPAADNGAAQVFTPDPGLSRTLALGTATMVNYSTSRPIGDVLVAKFTCVQTNTSNLTPVKFFINAVETHFLTLDSGEIGIK